MLKKIFSVSILIVLIYGFLISPEFAEIAAWVAIFLYGMIFLWDWFKSFTWWTLEKVLQKFSDKTWKWLIFWWTAATLMQSSSLVSILTISFLSAELITLVQWIWILFWANMWTTTGIWLMAAYWLKINIATFAMPMLAFWVILNFQKTKTIKAIWTILAWLWFLFLWIHYMKEGFEAFWWNIDLMKYSIKWFLWVFVFTLIGIFATVLMQSSHATLILVITALWASQVTYENALALAIWANVWTTITAVIGSLTANVNWKRLALADVLFKSITWILFIIFIYQISDFIGILANSLWISAENYVLKIALFHTLFNVIWVIIIIPFMKQLVSLLKKIFPENLKNKDYNTNIYLKWASFEFPNSSIIALTKESKRLFENATELILETLWLEKTDLEKWNYKKEEIIKKVKISEENIDEIYGKKIKILYSEIVNFATKAQIENWNSHYEDFRKLKYANVDIAWTIKTLKHIQRNISRFLKSRNPEVKKAYEDLVFDLLYVINQMKILTQSKDEMEKISILAKIEIYIKQNNILNNWKVNDFIKNPDIKNEIATSLIKDTNYKNEILTKLLNWAEVIFNWKVLTEHIKKKKKKFFFKNTFWLSDKKLAKIINKFENKKSYLNTKLKKTKIKEEKIKIKKEIENINFILEKYKK